MFLELGGKSANVVLDDADFARRRAERHRRCMHAGQGCAITTRLLLPRSRYDEGVEPSPTAFEASPTATRSDPATSGPVDQRQAARPACSATSRRARRRARALVVGGGRPAQFDKGYFVQPTLFVDVDNTMTIAQEEIFGPVLVVIPYEDDDDAVRIANDSSYGLSGAVTSGSEERATGRRPPHAHRHAERQRRPVVRPRHALRRLQGERR